MSTVGCGLRVRILLGLIVAEELQLHICHETGPPIYKGIAFAYRDKETAPLAMRRFMGNLDTGKRQICLLGEV